MNNCDPTDLQSQESAQADKAQRSKLARDTRNADFKAQMATRRGRRFIRLLLEMSGIDRPSFSTNAMTMAFADGRKVCGYWIKEQIEALCPELYHVMIKEALHENQNIDD